MVAGTGLFPSLAGDLKIAVAGFDMVLMSNGDLIEAALEAVPPLPTPSAPDRRRQFKVIEGGRS